MAGERLIDVAELEAMLRETGGLRVTHGTAVTWGHLRGRPELAFVEPGIRDSDTFVRLVGEQLPAAAIDETVLVERLDDAGVVVWSLSYRVRDRWPDPHSALTDLHLMLVPGA